MSNRPNKITKGITTGNRITDFKEVPISLVVLVKTSGDYYSKKEAENVFVYSYYTDISDNIKLDNIIVKPYDKIRRGIVNVRLD